MILPSKIAIPIYSDAPRLGMQLGLGDLLRQYHKEGNILGRLKSFKENHLNIKLKILLSCHNPQGKILFEHVPYFDVEQIPWNGYSLAQYQPRTSEEKTWTVARGELLKEIQSSLYETPEIYLTQEEKNFVNRIISRGPYVVIHPFAGEPIRMPLPSKEYIGIIQGLTSLELRTVVVGGSYIRGARQKRIKPRNITENFVYNNTTTTNLVNESNIRVITQLIRNCFGFVGTWSCCSCIACETDRPTVILCGPGAKRTLERGNSESKWHKNCYAIAVKKGYNYNKIKAEAIKFYKYLLEN